MRNPLRHLFRHPLGYRLFGFILLTSTLLSLLSTSVIMGLGYRWGLRAIEERMEHVEVAYRESLANGLWSFNEAQIRAQLRGIEELPDIEHLVIQSTDGEHYAVGAVPAAGERLTREVPLVHQEDGRRIQLGTFRISAGVQDLHQRLREQLGMVLATQLAQTVLIGLMMLFLFQLLVTRHLGTMAEYTRRLRPDSLERPLELKRTRRRQPPDELDEVAQGINEMRVSLRTEIGERRRAEEINHYFSELSKQLSVSLELQAVTDTLCRFAVPELGDVAACFVVDDGRPLRLVSTAAFSPEMDRQVQHLLGPFPAAVDLRWGEQRVFATDRVLRLERLTDAQLPRLAPDPQQRWVLRALGCRAFAAVPLLAHGRSLGVLVLMRVDRSPHHARIAAGADGEESKLLEELGLRAALAVDNALLYRKSQQAIRMRDEFLTVASHELNTPLTTMRLHAQQLERLSQNSKDERALRRPVQRTAQKLDHQVERLRTLVRSLLDVTELQSGPLPLRREAVDLREVCQEAIQAVAPSASGTDTPVQVLAPPEPVVGAWDRPRLRQVIEVLLSNARKFGSGHPVTVQVSVDSDAGRAWLSVRDQGAGIPHGEQARIFERFERAVSERNYGGIGLGLFLARELTEAHGGRIHVRSAPGEGSTFTLELPMQPSLTSSMAASELSKGEMH